MLLAEFRFVVLYVHTTVLVFILLLLHPAYVHTSTYHLSREDLRPSPVPPPRRDNSQQSIS